MSKDNAPWPAPRFLLRSDIAPRVGSDPESVGYTELAARGMYAEPEPLDEADWDRHVGKEVDQRAKARAIERERSAKLLSQEEMIIEAQQAAALKRLDVSREMWVLRQMQAKQRSPEKIEKRVQHLQRIVYLGRAA